ncbi:hypothetical protein PLICRDRAFT_46603 [Plicaturopsis crispa FD-325 SS-3]|uniref:Uncharacterized protein n=1 Tax=Plicaturopsis crispa FD-325 SS-3 TaxID=944288 RepID=A0A0C9SKS1_PLICR|nr:hypothetical protein PLICRDRAFT_46603 [Plicaturopsis crispa FD-325 SS-3]
MSATALPKDSNRSNAVTSPPPAPTPATRIHPSISYTGDWVNYPPIPPAPRVERHWFYGWRIDPPRLKAWVLKVKGPIALIGFSSTYHPYVVMAQYSGYTALRSVLAVPEDITEPVDGVNYTECPGWAVSSNYSERRFWTRPSPEQLGRMVEVLGEPCWFLDGLGDPEHHYQYYM